MLIVIDNIQGLLITTDDEHEVFKTLDMKAPGLAFYMVERTLPLVPAPKEYMILDKYTKNVLICTQDEEELKTFVGKLDWGLYRGKRKS